MKKKIAYAVFTTTNSGLEYMVKGNFGDNKEAAEKWMENNVNEGNYPNGLFVKRIKY